MTTPELITADRIRPVHANRLKLTGSMLQFVAGKRLFNRGEEVNQ